MNPTTSSTTAAATAITMIFFNWDILFQSYGQNWFPWENL